MEWMRIIKVMANRYDYSTSFFELKMNCDHGDYIKLSQLRLAGVLSIGYGYRILSQPFAISID